MERATLEVPAMYADHHVIEVRRILFDIPGVEDVYASSSYGVVEVSFDPTKTDLNSLSSKLAEAGYMGSFIIPQEEGALAGNKTNGGRFSRHTTVYEQTRKSVSFGQNVAYLGRPLWPCPGMGVIKGMEE